MSSVKKSVSFICNSINEEYDINKNKIKPFKNQPLKVVKQAAKKETFRSFSLNMLLIKSVKNYRQESTY